MEENLPVKREAMSIDFSDAKMIQTLKATVAQGLTDHEFILFAEHCKSTGLNPFKKEVWAIKAGGRLQVMTGVQGFFTIANSHKEYDGMEVETIEDAQGNPMKAICKVYRKDRTRPCVGIALMKEFKKNTPIWQQMPNVMLTKVAKSIALREAFPQELNGLYTAEEMPPEFGLEGKPKGRPNPYDPPKVTSKVEPSIKTEEPKKLSAKMLLTKEAMEKGTAFEYDLHGIGNNCKDEEEKKATWKIAQRDFGAIAKDKVAYCFQAIPEFYDHLINDPIQPTSEQLKAEREQVSFDDGDDLPEDFNQKGARQ